jgi:hypothetical protein
VRITSSIPTPFVANDVPSTFLNQKMGILRFNLSSHHLLARPLFSHVHFSYIPSREELISTNNYLHGAEPLLISRQLCSYSGTSQHSMKSKGSLPCSQQHSTGPYFEPDPSSPYHPILSKIHFNTVHPPTSWSS